ncbi:MAG: formamidopyrimidine-DNA glycosylase, partial [Spirochaetia bacterium]|nr:formamidopyrimidine-DNA glycosylase [Spirochaetia bacterium]
MPEFPDVEVYVDRLSALTVGKPLEAVRVLSFFLLRTVDPPLAAFQGLAPKKVSRLGKRIVFSFEKDGEELHLVIHLMIAGRFHWKKHLAPIPKGNGLAAFDFPNGTLILTESGSKKRASLHAVSGKDSLLEFQRGGLEIFESSAVDFISRLRLENHTLKRTLTDPSLFSGIGNAYSDEILHRARLSPILLTSKISDEEAKRLFDATQQVLSEWKKKIADETGDGFP